MRLSLKTELSKKDKLCLCVYAAGFISSVCPTVHIPLQIESNFLRRNHTNIYIQVRIEFYIVCCIIIFDFKSGRSFDSFSFGIKFWIFENRPNKSIYYN